MRKAFLIVSAVLGIFVFANHRATAADLEKIRVSIIPINDVAPLFIAIQNGYFRDLGLEVDTTPSAGGAAGIPGLIGGSFDIVYGNVVSVLLAAQQGLDVKVIAAGTKVAGPETDTTPIIVRSDSGIKNGKDLEGKSIAVNTRNNVIWLYARAWIKATGGDPDKVAFKEIPFPQIEDALRQQRVDAAFLVAPFSIVSRQKGGLTAIANPYSDLQPGVDVGQYITTGKLLAAKPETIKKFVGGPAQGRRMVQRQPHQRCADGCDHRIHQDRCLDPQIGRVAGHAASMRSSAGEEDDGADDREQAAPRAA